MMSKKEIYFIMAIIAISALLIIFTNQITLREFPNSADEYAYLIMAETFSQGELSVPSPLESKFFDFFHIINDGKFYGKYPIGWPLFLTFGVLIKLPMAINLIFGILALILIFLTAKEISSTKTANITLLIASTSPYFIFNSASYFSHSSALFFSVLSFFIYIKNLRSSKISNFFLLGMTLGILFNIRPLDSIIILFCLLMHYLYTVYPHD